MCDGIAYYMNEMFRGYWSNYKTFCRISEQIELQLLYGTGCMILT